MAEIPQTESVLEGPQERGTDHSYRFYGVWQDNLCQRIFARSGNARGENGSLLVYYFVVRESIDNESLHDI